ncbi:Bro-N domain-containing protein [uncultured Pseudodesulfovibrio sp.]|uniref:BRO-N domain-containing protein n=1 Tax=uncultured Pseudodesulfovibrio sp. TaxID=2035858 RepID=UPI0029C66745|nr:Bro-N domain-containing protein [uncultured Pseudodesulfovibrio sp.]
MRDVRDAICRLDLHILTDDNGDPWFVAKDVCDILGFAKPADSVRGLDDDEKQTVKIKSHNMRGNPMATVINESGLYSLILRSRKPEAKAFKKWITAEVLPSIRKRGMYATEQTVESMLNAPDTMIQTLTVEIISYFSASTKATKSKSKTA